MIAPGIAFLHGGNDKGRDIVYSGSSPYNENFTGKWILQIKHKSKTDDKTKAANQLNADLANELATVFLKNQLNPDVYIFVINLPVSAALFDQLHHIFDHFCKTHGFRNKQFDIIGYHQLETCIEENEVIKWNFPNILSGNDLEFLLKKIINAQLSTRTKGWLNVIRESYRWFVATGGFHEAMEKLNNQHIILLSGPPKSGKTFIAEILALLYTIRHDYEPLRIDESQEFERFYDENKKQVFVWDDAFGKHQLSVSNADDWDRKLYSIFTLADDNHKLIFTSRENVYRAFIAFATINNEEHFNKIIVDASHLLDIEKEALLTRYVTNATLSENEQNELLYDITELTSHKNFSPESVRSFFAQSANNNEGKSVRFLFLKHLNHPDEYLGQVFQNLKDENKILLMSVLCAENAAIANIGYTYDHLLEDLDGKKIVSFNIVLEELDGSILRINRSGNDYEVSFHHPSMQEFLLRFLGKELYGALRTAMIKNVNNVLLASSLLYSSKLPPFEKRLMSLEKRDLVHLEDGINRMLLNPQLQINWIIKTISWLANAGMGQIPMLRLLDNEMFGEVKGISERLIEHLNNAATTGKLQKASCDQWSEMLGKMQTLCVTMGMDIKAFPMAGYKELLAVKKEEPGLYKLVLRINMFVEADELLKTLGGKWFNDFYLELKGELYSLGYEIYGDDFPEFNKFNALSLAEKRKLANGKILLKPGKTWYPRFLICKEKIQLLKNIQNDKIGQTLLPKLIKLYEQLVLSSQYTKNRHLFLVQKGWWKDLNIPRENEE